MASRQPFPKASMRAQAMFMFALVGATVDTTNLEGTLRPYFLEKLSFHVKYLARSGLTPEMSDSQMEAVEALHNYFLQMLHGYLMQIETQSPQDVVEGLRKRRLWEQILNQWL